MRYKQSATLNSPTEDAQQENIMIVEYIEIDESITLQVIGRLDMPGAVLVVTTSDSDGERRDYHYSD